MFLRTLADVLQPSVSVGLLAEALDSSLPDNACLGFPPSFGEDRTFRSRRCMRFSLWQPRSCAAARTSPAASVARGARPRGWQLARTYHAARSL